MTGKEIWNMLKSSIKNWSTSEFRWFIYDAIVYVAGEKMTDKIPLLRPYFGDEELAEIKQVLDSGWVSQGPKTKEFEEAACDYIGAKHAIAVTNCTSALHLSLLAMGIKSGDEILVADYTYPATGHSVAYCGAKPVFVDIDPRTYNINPAAIEEKITENSRAIIPVHTFG